jgi:hypothetical protein
MFIVWFNVVARRFPQASTHVIGIVNTVIMFWVTWFYGYYNMDIHVYSLVPNAVCS